MERLEEHCCRRGGNDSSSYLYKNVQKGAIREDLLKKWMNTLGWTEIKMKGESKKNKRSFAGRRTVFLRPVIEDYTTYSLVMKIIGQGRLKYTTSIQIVRIRALLRLPRYDCTRKGFYPADTTAWCVEKVEKKIKKKYI